MRPSAPRSATPVSTVRAASLVAGLQLRRRVRDRSALLQGIVAPILLAVIIAAAFGGGTAPSTTIGVVDLDGGDLGATLVEGPTSTIGQENPNDPDGPDDPDDAATDSVELVALRDRDAAREAIDEGDAAAAIVIPSGFGDALATEPLPLEVLADEGSQLGTDIAEAIAARVGAGVDATRLVVLTATSADPTLATDPGIATLASDAAEIAPPVSLGASAFGDGFDPIAYFAPSMAILFAFLTLGAGARTILVERREGTLARIRSTPTTDRAVLVGVTAAVVAVGLVSFLVVWLVTSVVFGASWGEPGPVIAVIVATVLAIAGISTLVAGLARTEAQADGASSVLAFGFALIGGGFLSPGDLPDALARVALITPNRWALDAFAELGAGATGISPVMVPIVVLSLIGLVAGAVGLRVGRLGPT